jgi:hypothetical protein
MAGPVSMVESSWLIQKLESVSAKVIALSLKNIMRSLLNIFIMGKYLYDYHLNQISREPLATICIIKRQGSGKCWNWNALMGSSCYDTSPRILAVSHCSSKEVIE